MYLMWLSQKKKENYILRSLHYWIFLIKMISEGSSDTLKKKKCNNKVLKYIVIKTQ